MPLPENEDDWDNLNIIFATQKGNIRRNSLSDFKNVRSNGKIAIRLDEDDSLIGVSACSEDDHILLATKCGKALRCPVESVRVFKGRTSDGVRGMKLAEKDQIISMTILKGVKCSMIERENYLSIPLERRLNIATNPELDLSDIELGISKDKIKELAINEQFILTVSENGMGKRTSAYEYRITDRGGSGIVNMDLSDKTGDVVAVMPASSDNELMLITDKGKLIRCGLTNVRVMGRSTGGVILFKTEADEKVVSASLIAVQSEDEGLEDLTEDNDSEL